MKKLIASLLAVFVAAVFGGFAFAASDDVVISFSVLNRATVSNVSSITANSGGNTEDAGTDIEAGTTITGDVGIQGSISTQLNDNNFDVMIVDSNDVVITEESDNNADLGNVAIHTANSGDNTAVAGTDIASSSPGYTTTTGDVLSRLTITNKLNTNKSKVVVNTADDVLFAQTILNRMELLNTALPTLNSGTNSHSAGTDIEGGVIDTGAAGSQIEINNELNNNEVDGTIADSNDIEVTVDADNNFELDNIATAGVNTGDNSKVAGTDSEGGRINTGEIISLKQILNKFNFNKFVFKVL